MQWRPGKHQAVPAFRKYAAVMPIIVQNSFNRSDTNDGPLSTNWKARNQAITSHNFLQQRRNHIASRHRHHSIVGTHLDYASTISYEVLLYISPMKSMCTRIHGWGSYGHEVSGVGVGEGSPLLHASHREIKTSILNIPPPPNLVPRFCFLHLSYIKVNDRCATRSFCFSIRMHYDNLVATDKKWIFYS